MSDHSLTFKIKISERNEVAYFGMYKLTLDSFNFARLPLIFLHFVIWSLKFLVFVF